MLDCTRPDILRGTEPWTDQTVGDMEFLPSTYKLDKEFCPSTYKLISKDCNRGKWWCVDHNSKGLCLHMCPRA